jgi:hypothetical protein
MKNTFTGTLTIDKILLEDLRKVGWQEGYQVDAIHHTEEWKVS